MKKYRSSVGQRIYPVEYSSMTGNTVPHVLNSFISLDSGDDYVSRESGNRKEGANQNNVGSGEGSQETEEVTNDGSTDYTAQEILPTFCSDLLSEESYVVREVCPR